MTVTALRDTGTQTCPTDSTTTMNDFDDSFEENYFGKKSSGHENNAGKGRGSDERLIAEYECAIHDAC